jgi:pSer/pThr/pTyr-binding forkhead associated (FHA) protein
LTGQSPGQPPIRFRLSADPIIIGRGTDVDLNLHSAAVSRHHATITSHDGEFTVTDLASTHGVLLNGLRVVSADLRDGDILQFADVILTFDER